MSYFFGFFDSIPAWLSAITSVVTAAAGIAALTPTRRDDRIIGRVLRVLDILALNVGAAKNRE